MHEAAGWCLGKDECCADYLRVVDTVAGVARAVGDDCAAATAISSLPFSDAADTSAATTESGDPTPACGNSRARSVWYHFTGGEGATLVADTFGTGYDTILSVYTGTCGALAPVSGGCNDDAGPGGTSQVSFAPVIGQTYYFMVTAFQGTGGALAFSLRALPTPTPTSSPAPTLTRTPTSTFTPTRSPTSTPTPGTRRIERVRGWRKISVPTIPVSARSCSSILHESHPA